MSRFRRLPAALVPAGLVLVLAAGLIPAQQPTPIPQLPSSQPPQPAPPPPAADPNGQPADNGGVDVLARGPIHEAFATTAEAPAPTPVVAKQPPEAIDELPPDQKPSGDNVVWIPGYWHWDEEATQFIWISGFWRNVPPGRVWVPGSWRQSQNGWQWVHGFWQEAPPAQKPQPELQYLSQPPASIESGPTVAAPTTTSFYVPGSWVWRGRYVWRPGFWLEYRSGWVWVPSHFRWTPAGYIFVEGYWDYPLANRGVLFAPVAFSQAVYVQPGYVYTPTYVVSEPCMMGAMFVRRGWGCYYFGDYYAPAYTTVGYTAWCGSVGPGGGFAVGFGVGRAWGYDPLWSYYSVTYRSTPGWSVWVSDVYVGRYNGTLARPPVTLVQQNTVINKITNVNVTNVTNNVTVVNKNVTVNNKNVTSMTMVAPLKVAKDLHPEARMQPISAQVRREEATHARQIRDVGVQRTRLETAAAVGGPPRGTDPPRSLKLDVPKNAVVRAQVTDEHKAPPHNPHTPAAPKLDPHGGPGAKLDPHGAAGGKFDPLHPGGQPKIDPKLPGGPHTGPTIPKVDPKLPVHPGRGDPRPGGMPMRPGLSDAGAPGHPGLLPGVFRQAASPVQQLRQSAGSDRRAHTDSGHKPNPHD